MSIELRFVTVISNDGITIFHKNYLKEELDEYLFSGFSSAMIAFSKELGDELDAIKMANQSIFYHEVEDDGVLIISVSNDYESEKVEQKLTMLGESDNLILMLEGSKLGIIQNENELFEKELEEAFNIFVPSSVKEIEEEDEMRQLKEALEELDDDVTLDEEELQKRVFLEALDEIETLD